MRALGWVLFGLLAVIAVGCRIATKSSSGASEGPASTASTNPIEVSPADTNWAADNACSETSSNLFGDVDSVSYDGYEVVRLQKIVHDKEEGRDIPVSYAVLKRNGKTLATFEGFYFGLGNETEFGFASLLGGEAKQLVVSQTVPHGGRQWIVDLSSGVRTIFDGKDWEVGDEDLCIHDYDGDGVKEISLAITTFWGFGSMSMAGSPLPRVVFKYDPKLKKYMPDRAGFAGGLSHIEEDVKAIDPNEKPVGGYTGSYLEVRLDIFLRYVYSGRERDGWSFFDKTYNLPDKGELKRKIKSNLDEEVIYRFIYGLRPLKRHSV